MQSNSSNTLWLGWPVVGRIVLGALLGMSALSKTLSPTPAISFLARLGLPMGIAPILVLVTNYVEMVLSVCLFLGLFLYHIARAALALLIVFTLVIIFSITNGIVGSCGCYGSLIDSELNAWAILKNVALMSLSYYLMWQELHPGQTKH